MDKIQKALETTEYNAKIAKKLLKYLIKNHNTEAIEQLKKAPEMTPEVYRNWCLSLSDNGYVDTYSYLKTNIEDAFVNGNYDWLESVIKGFQAWEKSPIIESRHDVPRTWFREDKVDDSENPIYYPITQEIVTLLWLMATE